MLRFERFNTFYIFNLHLDARWGRHNGAHLEDYSRAELKAIRGSRPEYLIMPATFGMWVVVMLFDVFCTKTGCDFINWLQNHCLPRNRRFSNLQGGIRVGIFYIDAEERIAYCSLGAQYTLCIGNRYRVLDICGDYGP